MTADEIAAQVPAHLTRPLAELTAALQAALGDDLVSVVLYGGAARDEHQRGRSDTNLLVVLKQVAPTQLRAIAPAMRRARKQIRLSPVVLSREELAASAETSAIELTEMQEQHVVLFGQDPLTNPRIEPQHLRLQVEHELRSKLFRLRHSYLRDARNARAVIWLMMNSFSSFLTLFAALLRLSGKQPAPRRYSMWKDATVSARSNTA